MSKLGFTLLAIYNLAISEFIFGIKGILNISLYGTIAYNWFYFYFREFIYVPLLGYKNRPVI